MLDTDRPRLSQLGPTAERRQARRSWPSRPSKRVVVKQKSNGPHSTSESRARLSVVLLLYFLGIIGVLTLAPFQFFVPSTIDVLTMGRGDWRDIITTGLLFVPLGFLYPLTRPGKESSLQRVFVLGLLIGGAIETTRLFEEAHRSSIIDVIASGVGAGAGALLLGTVNRRIRESARLAGRLSLEIPLMALIYLLIPVLLAASLSAADGSDSLKMISLLPLGLLGARLISAVQEHHFGPGGVFRGRSIAVVAAGWTALGMFPVLLREPLVGIGLVLLVALATAHESSIPAVHGGATERRFEAEVLRSAVPYIALYFIVATVLPLALGVVDWHVEIGLTGSDGDVARQMVRVLEPVTALTMLGYVLAETRGRRELRFRAVAMRIATECAFVALAIEGSRGFQRDAGASVVSVALMIGASLLGAGIYHHQRERIRWILIHRYSSDTRRTVCVRPDI